MEIDGRRHRACLASYDAVQRALTPEELLQIPPAEREAILADHKVPLICEACGCIYAKGPYSGTEQVFGWMHGWAWLPVSRGAAQPDPYRIGSPNSRPPPPAKRRLDDL